jgi:hypothetical protein
MLNHNRTLPLAITENDGHVTIRCTATPEQNGGERCVWSWRVSAMDAGKAFNLAVRHAFDRHMAHVPYPVEVDARG